MTTPDRTASVSKISHPKDQVKPKSRVIRLRNFETKLDWALYLARKGFSVFPLWWAINGGCACDGYSDNESDGEKCGDQGKHPLWFAARHGFKSATRDRRAAPARGALAPASAAAARGAPARWGRRERAA